MRISSLQPRLTFLLVFPVIMWLAVGNFVLLHADSGTPVTAPTKVSTTVVIDGNIAEAVWAPGLNSNTLPNDCTDFLANAGAPVTFFGLNDGLNLYLAFDIPDTSANASDALFLTFDPNHSHGTAPAAGDLAVLLTFSNVAATNAVPATQAFSGNGSGWAAGSLPVGTVIKYSRITAGAGKWQVEMKFPFSTGPLGFAFVYLNKTGPGVDCDGDMHDDDFVAKYPSTLSFPPTLVLPSGFPAPVAWGNLKFDPPPPTVAFFGPLCCSAADITFTPNVQPFTAGTPVNISATVHNTDATSQANNVNVEIRVHDFGTGGTVLPPFPLPSQITSIGPSGSSPSPSVTWPSPPAGLHGCIQAEIKPPTTSPYFITSGASIAQHNIDVACVSPGGMKPLKFNAFNPDGIQQALPIRLAQQVLLPEGFRGLTFNLTQPDRPLRAHEVFPTQLTVTAAADTPLTNVPRKTFQVPATAGGTAPVLRERSGTDSISIPVNSGERLHFAASGEVDLDGNGASPGSGPEGQNLPNSDQTHQLFLLRAPSASQYAGALVGSFDGFDTSFVVGKEGTLTVPKDVKELRLAVNDFGGGFNDNTGKGFSVDVSTLPAFETAVATPRPTNGIQPPTTVKTTAAVTLPQINIAATSATEVTAGEKTYHVLTYHGGVTYQFLVVNGAGHELVNPPGPAPAGKKLIIWLLLLLLLIIVIFIIVRKLARRKHRR